MLIILNSIHKRLCWSEKSHSDFKQIEYMTFFYFAQSAWYLIYCKVKQTSAECKTNNEVFGFAYAEWSRTYVKLVQGVFAIFPNRRLTSACPKLSKRVQSAKQKTKFLGLPMPSAAELM